MIKLVEPSRTRRTTSCPNSLSEHLAQSAHTAASSLICLRSQTRASAHGGFPRKGSIGALHLATSTGVIRHFPNLSFPLSLSLSLSLSRSLSVCERRSTSPFHLWAYPTCLWVCSSRLGRQSKQQVVQCGSLQMVVVSMALAVMLYGTIKALTGVPGIC